MGARARGEHDHRAFTIHLQTERGKRIRWSEGFIGARVG